MRILIVGGTGFLGGAATRAAVKEGHDVTVLTRGGKPVTEGAATVIADRIAMPDLTGQFDAVIDTCAYIPKHVDRLRDALGSVAHYVLVSSISAYDDLSKPDSDETALATPASQDRIAVHGDGPNGADAAAYGADYGPLKRSCEVRACDWVAGAALIRLGLIAGPDDYMDRFAYWLRRLDRDGDVPFPLEQKVQIIDVDDAGAFLVHLAVSGKGGVLNVTGEVMDLQMVLEQIVTTTGSGARLIGRPLRAFVAAGIALWSDLPLVVPDDGKAASMLQVNIDQAKTAGLRLRSLTHTITRTLAWDRQRRSVNLTCGMSPAQEAAVLAQS